MARALVLAVAGIVLSVGGHVAGGGSVSFAAVLVVGGFGAAAFGVLAGRRAGLLSIVGCMVACQLAFHLVMSLQPSAHAMAGMHDMVGMPASAMPTGRMLAGHAVATTMASLLLARGERLVWTLAALLAPRVRLVLSFGTGAGLLRPCRPQVDDDLRARLADLLEVGLRHRGPPAVPAA